MKQTSQSSVVDVEESTNEEALLRQLHLTLGIWSLSKSSKIYIVFFNIYSGSKF